jgi:hypothetical protein
MSDTTANFNAMLKRWMPYSLLKSEMEKRVYFLSKVNKKPSYKGGVGDIPFKAGSASSYRYGKLVNASKITQSKYVMGTINGYKEIWGAMKFLDQDLAKHDDLKQSFLEALLKELPDFVEGMKEQVSRALLNGPALTTVTDITNAATGVIKVSRPEMLEYGQYVEIGSTTALHTGWVAALDFNTKEVTIVTAMSDVDASTNLVDLTAGTTVSVGHTLRLEDGFTTALHFTSLPQQLLSAVNGGEALHFGKSKVKYPFLQAYNHSGAGYAVGTSLETIFEAWNRTKQIARMSNINEVIMSFSNLQIVMKELESSTLGIGTGRQFTAGDTKVNAYGWTTIQVTGVKGSLTLVGINELSNANIFGLDWKGIDLHSNGLFERRKSPSGNEFYEERTEDGFVYIVDIRFFGELVVSMPSYQFVIHSVPTV